MNLDDLPIIESFAPGDFLEVVDIAEITLDKDNQFKLRLVYVAGKVELPDSKELFLVCESDADIIDDVKKINLDCNNFYYGNISGYPLINSIKRYTSKK